MPKSSSVDGCLKNALILKSGQMLNFAGLELTHNIESANMQATLQSGTRRKGMRLQLETASQR